MQTETLVRMANQIADFFRTYPEAEAVAGIAGHLDQFWEPRMRADLLAAVAAGEARNLSPAVQAALQRLTNA